MKRTKHKWSRKPIQLTEQQKQLYEVIYGRAPKTEEDLWNLIEEKLNRIAKDNEKETHNDDNKSNE